MALSVCDNSFCPVSRINKEIRLLLKNTHSIAGLRLPGTDLLLCGTGAKSPHLRAVSGNCRVWYGRAALAEEEEALRKAQGIVLSFP